MRKALLFMTILYTGCLFMAACKKNSVVEQYTPLINPVVPDFTTPVTASVNGFITDENGNALEGATIKGGTVTITSDRFGYFKISNTAFAKSAGFVQVSMAGYFTGYRTFIPVEGKETFIRLQLIPKINTGQVEAGTGGTVTTAGGATITLPSNGVVVASGNTAYTGTVYIAAHWLDPSDMQNTSLLMPGDLTGVDSAGHLNVLQTFGMLAVELTGSSGELLQVAPGKKALLHFPLPSSIQATAPAYIPLWYFDETKGVWKQEGHAIKNGNSFDGEVSHFSFWNCDVPSLLARFTAQIVDSALNPLSNVPVTVTVADQGNSSRVCFTDTDGKVDGWVPANKNLSISIPAPCNEAINLTAISTGNEDIDLGTIKTIPTQYGGLLEGTVTKCNGSPVTDGFVVLTGVGPNAIINIVNGNFSAAGIICPGANVGFIAYDRETSMTSSVHNTTLITGINNAGMLQACTAVSGTDSIRIAYTGNPTQKFIPPQYLFGGNYYFVNDSTSISAIDLLNGSQQAVQFSFKGPAAPGTYPLSNNMILVNGVANYFLNPTSVTITSYGLIGQFISGHFNGLASPVNQVIYVDFNIQRDQ